MRERYISHLVKSAVLKYWPNVVVDDDVRNIALRRLSSFHADGKADKFFACKQAGTARVAFDVLFYGPVLSSLALRCLLRSTSDTRSATHARAQTVIHRSLGRRLRVRQAAMSRPRGQLQLTETTSKFSAKRGSVPGTTLYLPFCYDDGTK